MKNVESCNHCGKKLGKRLVLIVPPKYEVELGIAKIETICMACAKKEGRRVE